LSAAAAPSLARTNYSFRVRGRLSSLSWVKAARRLQSRSDVLTGIIGAFREWTDALQASVGVA
jgi:hypothetical protein